MNLCGLPPLPVIVDVPSLKLQGKRSLIHTQEVANKQMRVVKLDFELAVTVFPWCKRLLENHLEGS